MAGSASISRAQLVYGLCLPLAALIGFFLADPLRFSSLAVLCLIAGVLLWPLFLKWYHPLLVFSFGSIFMLGFLPGNLPLWYAVAAAAFGAVVVNRCLDARVRLVPPGGVAWALLAIAGVTVLTMLLRGGAGLGSLGSTSMGGKKYITILLAVAAYFVLVSKAVPPHRRLLYVGLLTLSGITGLLSHVAYSTGQHWLFKVVDPGPAWGQAAMEWDVQGQVLFRSTPVMNAANAIIGFLAAWIGVRGMLNLRRPWGFLIVVACLAVGTLGGFRIFLVSTGLFLASLFVIEGLHRTRYLALVVLLGLAGLGVVATSAEKLPRSVQRAVSFLPVRVDPVVKQEAQGSVQWRLEMWEVLRKEIPAYLLLGKGYAIDPTALEFSAFNARRGYTMQAEWAVLTGEYHNGPLSVLIPLGLGGAVTFGWFLVASVRRLWGFCRNGEPGLLQINRALLAMFVAKIILFTVFFGSLYSELVGFVCIIGLAESLNTPREVPAEEPAVWPNGLWEGGRA